MAMRLASWDTSEQELTGKAFISAALGTTQERLNPKKDSLCPDFLLMEWDEERKLKDGCAEMTKMPKSLREKGIQV